GEYDLEVAFDAGATDYITKPVKPAELRARLSQALRLKSELDRRQARELELLEVTRQLQQANEALQFLSTHDELTGGANRRQFDARLAQEWNRAVRDVVPLSLLLLDVDHFKGYNDHYGHQKGDECLRRVAHALSGALRRAGDFVARYGGEEFGVLLSHTGTQGATAVAEGLRQQVEALGLEYPCSPLGGRGTVDLGCGTRGAEARQAPTAGVGCG